MCHAPLITLRGSPTCWITLRVPCPRLHARPCFCMPHVSFPSPMPSPCLSSSFPPSLPQLHSGVSKKGIMGSCDPAPGLPKSLYVKYAFRGAEHEVRGGVRGCPSNKCSTCSRSSSSHPSLPHAACRPSASLKTQRSSRIHRLCVALSSVSCCHSGHHSCSPNSPNQVSCLLFPCVLRGAGHGG